MDRLKGRRWAARLIIGAFVGLGIGFGVWAFVTGEPGRGLLGFAAPLFLLALPLIKRWVGGHPYYLYIECFAFCILAYDIGCVWQRFDAVPMLDKVSHFLSGFVFTTLGYCLFLVLRRHYRDPAGRPAALGVGFAVFFSSFIAVVWEIGEFLGFLLTGHDSQHHLTTGVFDTMGDLITCFVGSLLCAASLLLYLKKGLRLPAGAVAHEVLGLVRPKPGDDGEREEKE